MLVCKIHKKGKKNGQEPKSGLYKVKAVKGMSIGPCIFKEKKIRRITMKNKTLAVLYLLLLFVTILIGIYHFFIKPLDTASMMVVAVINIAFTTQILFMSRRNGKEV